MIDAELLKILRCPENHQSLAYAEAELVGLLNRRIQEGKVRNHAGEVVREAVEAGLIREDRCRIYPVRNGIPILLIAESIELPS